MADPIAAPTPWTPLAEVAGVIGAFAEDDPSVLTGHLAGIGVDVDTLWTLPRWNAELPADDDRRAQVMGEAVEAALASPVGAALLGLHVWNLCSEAWEHTYRFPRLIGTVLAFEEAWRQRRATDPDPRSRAAGDAAAALAETLILEIEVEADLCRGDLTRQAAAASDTIAGAERLRELADGLDDGLEPLRELFADLAETLIVYYGALRTALESAAAALAGASGPAVGVNALWRAERHEAIDRIYRSELRAHRRNLERIAEAADAEWLTVDDARIVYLYPFGISGRSPNDAVEAVCDLITAPRVGDIVADAVRRSFDLDDVWAGSDYLQRRFEGAAIELPRVTLAHLDGEPIAELSAEVRVSQLGNHYLRLEGDLDGCDPQRLQFALFRAAPEHAAVVVACGETDTTWERLSDFADHVQQGIATLLTQDPANPVVARPGRYHVLLSIFEASAGRGPAAPVAERRPVDSGDDLLELFGASAVLAPVPNGISSICDWSRAGIDRSRLLRDVAKDGDLIAPTANTTVTAFLGSPSFIIGMFETVAEFVGSLDGLFSAWHDRLAAHYGRVQDLVTPGHPDGDAEGLRERAARLRAQQVALNDFAAEARSVLSLIHSPNLMTSPTDIDLLLKLVRANEVDLQELDFAAKLRELLGDRLEAHIDDLAARMQERVDDERRRQERFNHGIVQGLLAAVAAFGVAGVVQILQASVLKGALDAWISVAAIVILAATLSYAVFRWTSKGNAQ